MHLTPIRQAILTCWRPDGLGELISEPFLFLECLLFTVITPVRPTLGYTHQGPSARSESASRN